MNEIKKFFQHKGYYHARGVFTADEIAPLENAFDRIVRQLYQGTEDINARWSGEPMEKLHAADTEVLHTHNVQQYAGAWTAALFHKNFLSIAEAILGPDIILHHTKLFQKPPEKGAPFPMHQDWSYFPTIKDTMIAAVIHVSEATDAMGCLRIYPGSHRLGRLGGTSGQDGSGFDEKCPLEDAIPVEGLPGDVIFFHYFTVHGSMPNRSPRTRKTVLVQMHAGDDWVEDGNGHPNENLVLQRWNNHTSRHRATGSKTGKHKFNILSNDTIAYKYSCNS